jgi:hypothetical protein
LSTPNNKREIIMNVRRNRFVAASFVVCLVLLWFTYPSARNVDTRMIQKDFKGLHRVLVLDGSNVHDVGELQMHVSNWGLFGSYPGSGMPFADAPSAQWPAGSGVEYLFGAGIWVGAIKNGVPHVTSSMRAFELRPTDDPVDIIYRSSEGALGGNRIPMPDADDDRDGQIDEDWLNGRDDDLDGRIDEDYAAISKQMFSCWYTDDQPITLDIYPEHDPLPIMVRQESYQWEDDRFDDFVGIHFFITNIGTDVLEDIYLGLFIDPDLGPRNTDSYWEDDATGFLQRETICTDLGPAEVEIAYAYDLDGDEGQTPGYFGAMVLGHLTDPTGQLAPEHVGIATYANFAGSQPFDQGGDPTNDFERYELLSSETIERDAAVPRDYRMLAGTGRFARLEPGETLDFVVAFVVGAGLEGLKENAANAKIMYEGTWFNLDGNPMTGVDGRETPIQGPASDVVIDACRPELSDPIEVPARTTVWINSDCEKEEEFMTVCGYSAADSNEFRTGVGGKETQIHWILGYDAVVVRTALDIKPGSCDNPFNKKVFDKDPLNNGDSMKGGVLPVALLGDRDFDVTQVDMATVGLEGVGPLRYHFKDIAEPSRLRVVCPCPIPGPDGYMDMELKFKKSDIARMLGSAIHGDRVLLDLTGRLLDGTDFIASDCVRIIGKTQGPQREASQRSNEVSLEAAVPNPFNPLTRITYYLPREMQVNLSVYDVNGKLVERLIDDVQSEGDHIVQWNASGKASGVYFYRLTADDVVQVKRMILLK